MRATGLPRRIGKVIGAGLASATCACTMTVGMAGPSPAAALAKSGRYATFDYIAVAESGAGVDLNARIQPSSPRRFVGSPHRTLQHEVLPPTGRSPGTRAWGASSQQAQTPKPATALPFDHIFVLMLENHNYSAIIGSPAAPYLNKLVRAGGLATNYHAIAHPSLINYLATISGRTYTGINDNCHVSLTTCSTNAANLTDRIEAAGLSWKGYMEDMPSPCYTPHDAGLYVERHNPFLYFNRIRTNPARCAKVVPYRQLAIDLTSASRTPRFSWITPNLCHDMHNACPPSNSVTNGDLWAARELPTLFTSPAWKTQHSLMIITEDENGGALGNQVPAILLSSDARIKPGSRSATYYSHYSLLRTIDNLLRLAPVGPGDAGATPMLTMRGALH